MMAVGHLRTVSHITNLMNQKFRFVTNIWRCKTATQIEMLG